ncbi:hypothetical protein [Paracoccus sp. IB05]|uniref:hypothetical protein n=1 Tax=Paracoccus sp. IB05 TaxID=2779367 RepID=UPI0018E8F52B|nr:hypothetical protein [Paracoccus sp. IB05]MBJ2153286.1 hypothetical protein [Paracoccus sp. IB05]
MNLRYSAIVLIAIGMINSGGTIRIRGSGGRPKAAFDAWLGRPEPASDLTITPRRIKAVARQGDPFKAMVLP